MNVYRYIYRTTYVFVFGTQTTTDWMSRNSIIIMQWYQYLIYIHIYIYIGQSKQPLRCGRDGGGGCAHGLDGAHLGQYQARTHPKQTDTILSIIINNNTFSKGMRVSARCILNIEEKVYKSILISEIDMIYEYIAVKTASTWRAGRR